LGQGLDVQGTNPGWGKETCLPNIQTAFGVRLASYPVGTGVLDRE